MTDPFNQNYRAPLLFTECPVCEKLIVIGGKALKEHCEEVNDDAHLVYEIIES